MSKTLDFNNYAIKLSEDSHLSPKDGLCVMECVAYMAGEAHSDRPECACPVITSFAIMVNDNCLDIQRNKLLNLILRMVGSRSTKETELKRAYLVADFAIRRFIVKRLTMGKYLQEAQSLTELPSIIDEASVLKAKQAIKNIIDKGGMFSHSYSELAGSLNNSLRVLNRLLDKADLIEIREYKDDETKYHLSYSPFIASAFNCCIPITSAQFYSMFFNELTVSEILNNQGKLLEELFNDQYELLDAMLKLTDDVETLPEAVVTNKLSELETITSK